MLPDALRFHNSRIYRGLHIYETDGSTAGSYQVLSDEVHLKAKMPGLYGKTVHIAWSNPADNENATFWPMDFYSTLPYGWVPEGGLPLYCLFLDHLKQLWLDLCKEWHAKISSTVCLLFRFSGEIFEMLTPITAAQNSVPGKGTERQACQ